ncbi:MAG: T9SS type A sorting domain-containing protein, partial [Saprospiraceae bacterium]
RQGNLNYFQNIGNITSPSFINTETTPPNSNFLGQVDTRDLGSASGLSSARFLDYNGQYSLYCGSQTGYLKQYNSIEGNLNGAFNRLSERFANVTEGGRTVIDFADIDNDSLYEMVVGNFRGGMSFYDTDIRLNGYSSNTKEPDYFINFSLSPNPTTGYVQLDIQNTSETNGNIIVYDMLGRLVFNSTINFQTDEIKSIDLSQVPAGIYIVQITSNNIAVSNKIVKE